MTASTHLVLNRDDAGPQATLGWMVEPRMQRKWPTIERPWVPSSLTLAGAKGMSCVPLGEYRLVPYSSDAFPRVWALSAPQLDVYVFEHEVPPGRRAFARTRCLIHAANWAAELRGCIAPGKDRVRGAGGTWMVTRSRDAINELRNALGASLELHLTVTSGAPP